MKIAIISSCSSIHVKKIANALVARGHEITIYTLPQTMKIVNDFSDKITIKKLPFGGKIGYYLNALYLRKEFKKNKYDLYNSHYASGYGTLVRLAGCHPLALAVFGADVYDVPFKSSWHRRLVIKNLRNADVITSTSHVMADKVREYYHDNRPIYVTPFGVDLDRFRPQPIEKDDVFEFGIVKKIEPKYGIDILIKAYKQFRDNHPDEKSRLVIYGRGSYVDEYKGLSSSLGISDNVLFKGFVSNEQVPEAFSRMDVACFPSVLDSESFGVAAVEAMACGTPVIVSDASGFTEVVVSGETGLVDTKKNQEALLAAMEKMFAMSKEERLKMGEHGVARVRRLYNFEDNMDTYFSSITKMFENEA